MKGILPFLCVYLFLYLMNHTEFACLKGNKWHRVHWTFFSDRHSVIQTMFFLFNRSTVITKCTCQDSFGRQDCESWCGNKQVCSKVSKAKKVNNYLSRYVTDLIRFVPIKIEKAHAILTFLKLQVGTNNE